MKKILIAGIKLYQKYLSPVKGFKCPYYPCCSQYGLDSIRIHGSVVGGIMAFWRLLRCNPFSKGGYDPVPEKLSLDIFRKNKRIRKPYDKRD